MLTSEQIDEVVATLTLSRLQGLTQSQALALVARYGSASAALADDAPADPAWAMLQQDTSALHAARERALQEYDFCQAHNIRVITVTSEDYPRRLLLGKVEDRPLQLFYCGTGDIDRRYIISVVGTRNITEYGKKMCEKLIAGLAEKVPNALIVSGLAYGVDIHAHRAALVNNIDTLAVLAHGLDRIYPRMHRETAQQMTQHGGLLTEYFTGAIPDKGHFIRRNRIVAGMSSATIVIESASHGGSLVTARLAGEYGRRVMAVPGRATDACSEGCNNLIRDGKATLVTCADDIVRLLGWESALLEKKEGEQRSLFVNLSPDQQKVCEVLQQVDDCTLDRLSQATDFTVSELTDILFDLEDENLVKHLPGNRYCWRG